MALTAQDVFNLPDHKRRKLKLVSRKRGKYRKIKRPKRSREELVAFLREHDIRSSRMLEKRRGEGDPTLSDYRLAFPLWSEAVTLAFGRQDKPDPPPSDPEYMAKLLIQFDISSLSRYQEVRKMRPDIVPSYGQVKRKWGGFKGLKLILRRYSLIEILNSYLALRRRLGRHPTPEECLERGIVLSKAKDVLGGKKKLEELLDSLGGSNAN
jgi:hypothetical protein